MSQPRSEYTSAGNIMYSHVCTRLCIMLLMISVVSQAQVTIITQPMNVTVCLSQTANFTCVVNAGSTGITTVGWQIMIGNGYATVLGRDRHMVDVRTSVVNTDTIITETLTVTDVSLSDNGTKYRCQPFTDVTSDVVTLTVVGPPSAVSNIRFEEMCTTSVTVSWNPSTSNSVCDPLIYIVSLSPNVNQGPFTTSDTNISLDGLAINNFNVTILPTNMAGNGNSLAESITLPNIADAVPGGVINLRNTSFTTSSADIAWDAAAPAPNMYCGPVLYYTILITDGNTNRTINSTGLTTAITGLMSNTTYNIRVVAFNKIGSGMSDTIFITTAATGILEPGRMDESNSSLSTGVVAVIAAVSSSIVSIVITAIITFVITAHYYKRKVATQPIVSRTGVIEYEEITKTSVPDNNITTDPSYDVAMTSNPAYAHNVKKIDQSSDYYN